MQIDFIPLGTNGHIPTDGRHTMSFLLLHEKRALLLDAGTGIARLCQEPLRDKLAPYDTLHVLLSHFHLDHTIGLFYLLGSWNRRPVHVHVPQFDHPETSGRAAMEQFFSPPLVPECLDDLSGRLEVHTIRDETFELDPFSITLWRQQHPGGSLGVRLGDLMAYTTDKAVRESELPRVKDVAYLVHEVWLTDEEARDDPNGLSGHSCISEVATFAQKAGVRHLMPVHHHPRRRHADLEVMAGQLQEQSAIPTILLEEGRTYTLRDDS